jgi:hypothetical protein
MRKQGVMFEDWHATSEIHLQLLLYEEVVSAGRALFFLLTICERMLQMATRTI